MSQDGGVYSRANYRRSGRRGTIHQEHDPLTGEDFGFSVVTASATDVTVYTVPSLKTFHIKTLIIDNGRANTAKLKLFASDGGGKQRVTLTLPAQDTLIIGPGELQGLIFGFSGSTGGLYAQITSASTEVNIFAGGQVRDADRTY